MNQFKKILKFELSSYLQNKIFMGITIVLALVIATVISFPRFQNLFSSQGSKPVDMETEIMVVKDDTDLDRELFTNLLGQSLPGIELQFTTESVQSVKDKVAEGTVPSALIYNGDGYTYVVSNLSMNDSKQYVTAGVLTQVRKIQMMRQLGLSLEDIDLVLMQAVEVKVENLGIDQGGNFLYTYVMIFALYMVVVIYGQMVATNVASEKSSRAMELLITSAKPSNMLFGKVIASGLAGLIQLVAVFGTAALFYGLNKSYWQDNNLINSLFSMPPGILIYMLLFFILGYFLYASLFGAVGSLATKTEDVNTLSMPVLFCFVAAYLIVIFPISFGNVDAGIVKIASYVPLSSPFAMFSRIVMSSVSIYEIVLSVTILIVTAIGIGFLSAKIYRVGVLMYGTKPKIGTVIKSMIKA